jgi:hypothetical protein
VTVSPDNHGDPLNLFRIICFDDVDNIKSTEGGKAILPSDTAGTFLFNLLRNLLG